MPHLKGEQHPQSKITTQQATAIRTEYIPGKVSGKQLAHKYGLSLSSIYRILNGMTWTTEKQQSTTNQ